MFDITSSKLLILGIVALLVIGPKDLPALLRTIGKYMGIIKRQAAEFRAQFDEAMRESELHELKKSVETIQQETEASMREATSSVEKQLADASQSVNAAMEEPKPAVDPMADYLGGPPAANADASAPVSPEVPAELNGASHPFAEKPATAAGEPGPRQRTSPRRHAERARLMGTEKSGA